MRVLTGPRWQLGGRDISALWRRAVELDGVGGARESSSSEQIVADAAQDADAACLADAIDDPGTAAAYSPEGHRRITALGHELTGLRSHLAHPLPELGKPPDGGGHVICGDATWTFVTVSSASNQASVDSSM